MIRNNIILTGLPRSGTTLICKILSEHEGIVALNEPLGRDLFDSRRSALEAIEHSFSSFRHSLFERGVATARTDNGEITDNAFSAASQGKRRRKVERREIYLGVQHRSDFLLIMKHCAEFALLLSDLAEKYPCYACIRNPLALLGSWNSVSVPVSRGRVAKSKKLDPMFYRQLDQLTDLLEKQLYILNWYFKQFALLDKHQIIRYEDCCATNGALLSKIVDNSISPMNVIENKNYNNYYDREYLFRAGEHLLDSEGAYWNYYHKQEVENLLDEYARR